MNGWQAANSVFAALGDRGREQIGQHAERLFQPLEEFANLPGRPGPLLPRHALSGVGEKELVAFLDGVDASLQLAGSGHPSVESRETTQRCGSWCSRYRSRSTYPKIIDFVIHSFSGRMAK